MINLLRYSATTPDVVVSMTYNEFMTTLDTEQQQHLKGRGLLIPLTTQDLIEDDDSYLSHSR